MRMHKTTGQSVEPEFVKKLAQEFELGTVVAVVE
jgi:hypothetical protein